jgi:hypothetical protein
MPMMAITTSNSTSVKARRRRAKTTNVPFVIMTIPLSD